MKQLLPVWATGAQRPRGWKLSRSLLAASRQGPGSRQVLASRKLPTITALAAFFSAAVAGFGLVILLMWQPAWTWSDLFDAMGGDITAVQASAIHKVRCLYTLTMHMPV
jgi:hypothetical protein